VTEGQGWGLAEVAPGRRAEICERSCFEPAALPPAFSSDKHRKLPPSRRPRGFAGFGQLQRVRVAERSASLRRRGDLKRGKADGSIYAYPVD
jgi:hypothetical protein